MRLPLEGRVPFSDEEVRILRRQAWMYRLIGIPLVILLPIFLIGGIILLVEVLDQITGWLLPVIMLAYIGVVALILLFAGQSLERAKRLFEDIRSGEMLRFTGTLTWDDVDEVDQVSRQWLRFHARGWCVLAPGEVESLTVLAASKRLLMVHGHRLPGWWSVELVSTSDTPEFAATAAQWLEPVGEIEGQVIHGNHRELSQTERDELRMYAFRLWWGRFWYTLLISIWSGILLYFAFQQDGQLRWDKPIGFYLLLLLAVSSNLAFFYHVVLAIRIAIDRARGEVLILNLADLINVSTRAVPSDISPDDTFEWLPTARMVWTVNGKPAPWRRMPDKS
jgi:hypothetical protein